MSITVKTLYQLGERGLIALLKKQLPTRRDVRVGIGDDCAAVELQRIGPDRLLLLKTDAVVEGIHFDSRATAFRIGWKAMARPLSDIGAMAGQPRWALVSAGLREGLSVKFIQEIYRGLNAAARRFGVTIVGGETVRMPDRFWLNVALAGEVESKSIRLRSGARSGDAIFVTGRLGGSITGKHLTFVPRIAEAQWLAAHCEIHAMIDISDGLVRDLGHICRESGLGALLVGPAIPMAPAANEELRRALYDGEDYELLFTVPARAVHRLMSAWRRKFPRLPLTMIGRITRGKQVMIADDAGQTRVLEEGGYDHFQPGRTA